MPPLVAAAWRGQEDVVRSLLAGPDSASALRARDGRGHTALSRAAEAGHGDIVSALLAAGADAAAATPDGRQPLSWSAAANRAEAVRKLLASGATLDAADDAGRTALSYAAERGATKVVRILLDAGAALGAKPIAGAPLVVAAVAAELEVLGLLAEKEENPGRRAAALCGALQGDADGRVVQALTGRWPELANRSCGNHTHPLDLATHEGSLEAVSALLRAGAKPGGGDSGAVPPLLVAARRGDAHVLAALLDAGANVNARGPARETALTEAATVGKEDAIALLIERGADAGARTAAGYTAAELASRRGHEAIAERLSQESQSLGSLLWSDD